MMCQAMHGEDVGDEWTYLCTSDEQSVKELIVAMAAAAAS